MKKGFLGRLRWSMALPMFLLAAAGASAGPIKIEACLIWGCNDAPQTPDPKLKPAQAAIEKKLKEMPFQWKHYYAVHCTNFVVGAEYTSAKMSEKCTIHVKALEEPRIKVKMEGQGKDVARHEKPLPKGETLVFAGEAENKCAWFIVLRRLDK